MALCSWVLQPLQEQLARQHDEPEPKRLASRRLREQGSLQLACAQLASLQV